MAADHASILNQVAAGELSAEEAARRLRAVNAADPRALAQRWLHVRVTDLDTGLPKVTVNLPLTWVAAGLKVGARYSPHIAGLDINQILAEFEAGTTGQLIDVENLDEGQRVEVFVD